MVFLPPVHAEAMQAAQARFERKRTVLFEKKIKDAFHEQALINAASFLCLLPTVVRVMFNDAPTEEV